MTLILIVIIVFYFVLFELGYIFGKMDKKSNEVPMKPPEIKCVRYGMKQWGARQEVGADEFQKMDSGVIENYVARMLADKFVGVIKQHMTVERDVRRRTVIYSIDIWLNSGTQKTYQEGDHDIKYHNTLL